MRFPFVDLAFRGGRRNETDLSLLSHFFFPLSRWFFPSFRSSIPAPNVTQGTLVTAFPFSNGVVDVKMTGKELWDLFEGVASKVNKVGKVSTFH